MMMKRILITGAIAAAFLTVDAAAVAEESDLAAKVNGAGIARARLQHSMDAMLQQQGVDAGAMRDLGQYEAAQRRVLDVLISQELLWQEAKNKDFVAADGDVEAAVGRAKERFPSEQEFLTQIGQSGFTAESYAEDLKRQLSVRRMVDADIVPGISVDDKEVDDFYAANPDQMKMPEEIRARHILIKLDADADEAAQKAAKERLEKILAEAKGGADFAELAKQHSEGPSAPQGGDLGFFGRGKMVPPFEQAAFALEPNAISDIVQTRFGYHIIRVEERRGGVTLPKEAVTAQIRSYLKRQKVQAGIQDLVQDLRASGNVEVLLAD